MPVNVEKIRGNSYGIRVMREGRYHG